MANIALKSFETASVLHTLRKQVYFAKRVNLSAQKMSIHRLSYGSIKDDFQTIINKWFAMNFIEETRDAVALYTESYEGGTVIEIMFLVLFQACEGLAKRIEPDSCKKASASDVLKHILLTVKDYLPEALCDENTLDRFAKKANKTRNYWIHNSGGVKKTDIFGRELFEINAILRYALRIYLLLKTGVNEIVLSSSLDIQQIVGNISVAEFEAMLNALETEKKEDTQNV